MITAKAAQELAQPVIVDDLVNQSTFYIDAYVKGAVKQGQTSITYVLGEQLRETDGAAAALTKALEDHEFAVTRDGDTLTISWATTAA